MLKTWLPLTINTNNQGTDSSYFYNTGTTVASDGPIGNCYSFNGTSNKIQGSYPCYEAAYTACMWVNFSKINVHLLDMRATSGEVGYQPMYVGSSGVQVGGSSNGTYTYINFVPTLDTWYHLCITADSTNGAKLYVNGEYYGSAANAKAYNYNRILEVHLGSRCTSVNWFGGKIADFRIYNECLTAKQVKAITRVPILHYKYWNSGDTKVTDSSGFGRDATINGTITSSTDAVRYDKSIGVGSSASNYFYVTSPSTETKTVAFWLKTPKSGSTVCFADYKSKMAFGLSSGTLIIATCDSWNKPMFASTKLTANQFNHIVIRHNAADNDVELFINGVQETSRSSNNYWTHNSNYFMVGRRSSGTPMSCDINDIRAYAVRLTDDEILDLYHTSLKQMADGTCQTFELVEDTVNKVRVGKNGQLISNEFVESTVGNKFSKTQVISNEFIER